MVLLAVDVVTQGCIDLADHESENFNCILRRLCSPLISVLTLKLKVAGFRLAGAYVWKLHLPTQQPLSKNDLSGKVNVVKGESCTFLSWTL